MRRRSMALIALAATAPLVGGCTADESAERQRREAQAMRYLEQKIGECHRRDGVARLDPVSGYLGCDLPVLRRELRS